MKSFSRRRFDFLFFFSIFLLSSACATSTPATREVSSKPKHQIKNISVCGKKFKAWIADTGPLQMDGLMHFPELNGTQAMLFIFGREEPRSFWMKNVPFDLDIAFFDAKKKLVSKMTMKGTSPLMREVSLPHYPSTGPAQFAVETRVGALARLLPRCELIF